MVPSPRPRRISAIRSIFSSSVMALMNPVISRTTGSPPSSSSTSTMLSSAPFDPESGSDAPSLTSNSRVFSIKKRTFSAEIANSGIGALPGPCVPRQRAGWRDDPLRGLTETSIFASEETEMREMPDALDRGQGQNHQNRRTGDDRQHTIYPAAGHQRRNPEIALAHSRFRHRGGPAQNVDPLAGGGDALAPDRGRYRSGQRQGRPLGADLE